MSPRSKQQFEEIRQQSKQKILDAALELFATDSYHGSSVSKLAKEAGVSKGLLYNYFDSKEDVLKTLLQTMSDRIIQKFEFPEDGHYSDQQFERFIDISFDIIQEDPLHTKLFFSLAMQPYVMEFMLATMLEKIAPYMILLTDYFQRKGFDEPESMVRYFSAAMDGVQMHLILDPEFPVDYSKMMLKKQFTAP